MKIFQKLQIALSCLLVQAGLASCNSLIYDDQGDCDPYYKVRFVYDMNMKFVDAFPKEVNSVTLYVIDDATGTVVWSKHENGEALRSEGYEIDVDIAPGQYSLLAWAGDGHKTHFTIPETQMVQELECTLGRGYNDDEGAVVDHDLDRLYHGVLRDCDFPDEQGVHVYTVPLMKNTNNITVMLQHLSGAPVDHNQFDFTITDDNGRMAWDNDVLKDEQITYRAHYKTSGTASVRPDESRAVEAMSAAIAEHTVARLMESHKDSARLTVTNKENGEVLFSIPYVQYLLLVKGYHNREMSDQEYLDRQDQYNMTFFLDENNRWISSYIYIESWKIVFNDHDL